MVPLWRQQLLGSLVDRRCRVAPVLPWCGWRVVGQGAHFSQGAEVQAFQHQMPAGLGVGWHRIAQLLQARERPRRLLAQRGEHFAAVRRMVGQAPGLAQVSQRILRLIARQRKHRRHPVDTQLHAGDVECPGPLPDPRCTFGPGFINAGLVGAEAGDGQVLCGHREEHQAAIVGLGQLGRLLGDKACSQLELVAQARGAVDLHGQVAFLGCIEQGIADLRAEQGSVLGHVQVSGPGEGLAGWKNVWPARN